jgi:hypothetical protein
MAKSNLVTGTKDLVRLSFVHVAEPQKNNDGTEKYGVCIMIPKDKEALKSMFDEAINEAAVRDAAKWGGKVPKGLHLPIHDGDDVADERPEFADMWYLNATSRERPGVLDEEGNRMLDFTELYSGCWARVGLNFAGYSFQGNKGIGAYINNIQKMKDDTRLGGSRASAESDFGIEDDDDDDLT